MKNRAVILAGVGAVLVVATYFILSGIVRRAAIASPGTSASFGSYTSGSTFAPVSIWGEAPPGEHGYWKVQKAVKILVLKTQAFVGDELLPIEKITAYLDARVLSGEIDYVVVFAAKESRWGDIFPVIDQCRRSKVQIVLVNYRDV